MFRGKADLRIPKMPFFISVRGLEMLKIAISKNDIINGYGFWTIVNNRDIELKLGMPGGEICVYNLSPRVFFF